MSDYEASSGDSDREYFNEAPLTAKRSKTYPYRPILPVIRTNPPSLKDITSAVIAVSLWKYINIFDALSQDDNDNIYCAEEDYCWDSLKEKVEILSSRLPIPYPVQEQINEKIGKVQMEIINWATYHFRTVFLYTANDYIVYSYVNYLIWHPDGTINCKETAKNLSKSRSPRLSDLEKFNFLCIYCLKDEIENMLQMSPFRLNIFQNYLDFDQHPLIRYWSCYFSKELHSIPNDEDLSLDCFMFRRRFVDNWPAKEYFFDLMSADDQIRNAIWLITRRGIVYQKLLLMKLNSSQRTSVYLERCVKIIMNYVKNGVNSTEDVLVTWSEVRNVITRQQFVSLFAELLLAEKAQGIVLTNIWTNVDVELKNHLLKYNNYEFIEKIFKSFEWTQDLIFCRMVLQDLKADMKTKATEQFFYNFCEKLLSQRENLRWFDRLLDAYGVEDSRQFKKYFVMNSKSIKKICFNYYSSGDVRSLNDMLTYLLSRSPDCIPEYKKILIESVEGMSHCVDLFDSKIDALNEIINDAFLTTDSRTDFRKKLVNSFLSFGKLRSLLFNNDFDNVKNIIDSFLTSDEDKRNLKKLLIGDVAYFMRNSFTESCLESLLLWVFEEETRVREFKNSIHVDTIFNQLLENDLLSRSSAYSYIDDDSECSFSSLDKFLNWYFESPSEVKKYKLRRIYSYEDIFAVKSLLHKKRNKDFRRLKSVLKWFFDEDETEIAKFNEMFKNNGKIATVL